MQELGIVTSGWLTLDNQGEFFKGHVIDAQSSLVNILNILLPG